jgi:hypothetical protein
MNAFGKVVVLMGGARWSVEQGPQRSWGCDRGVAPGHPSETACTGPSHE